MATPRSNIVKLRLTDLEKADWQKAAGSARGLSEFIRRVVNAECNRLRREELPEGMNPPYEEHQRSLDIPVNDPQPSPPEGDAARQSGSAATGTRGGEQCPRAHHHRPGVYCGTCKKVATKVGE